MDKIQKALNKLSAKEQKVVKEILTKLYDGNLLGLNIQQLKSYKDIYRIRKGDMRIIYRKKDKDIFLLTIQRRSEKTYRDF